jgi:hypothetical protein
MKRLSHSLVVALIVGAGVAALASARSPIGSSSHRSLPATASVVRSCRPRYFGLFDFRRGQEYLSDLSVRNMTCAQAIHALHHAYLVGWPPTIRAGGFGCYILQGGEGGATDRCVHNRPYRAFRVTIAT